MGELINLGRARKDRARAEAKDKAAANRAAHGRTRSEKALEKTRSEKAARDLDQHRLDPAD